MTSYRSRLIVVEAIAAVVAAGLVGCQKRPEDSVARRGSSATDTAQGAITPLRPLQGDTSARTFVRLDQAGNGTLPFATASGKLLVQETGGQLLSDVNGDGKLDQEDGGCTPRQGSFSVPVQLGDRSVPYQLKVEMLSKGWVVLSSRTRLQGTVGDATVLFVDANVDGRFGQPGTDSYQVGSDGTCLRQGRVLEIDDALYQVDMMEGGGSVSARAYAGPVAALEVAPAEPHWEVTLRLAHMDNEMYAEVSSGQTTHLMPGSYRIGQATARFSKGASGVLTGAGGGDAASLTVAPGDNRIQAGPPFRLEFSAFCLKDSPADVEIEGVTLVGSAGEQYRARVQWASTGLLRLFAGGSKSRLECFVKQPEQEHRLSTLEYG